MGKITVFGWELFKHVPSRLGSDSLPLDPLFIFPIRQVPSQAIKIEGYNNKEVFYRKIYFLLQIVRSCPEPCYDKNFDCHGHAKFV